MTTTLPVRAPAPDLAFENPRCSICNLATIEVGLDYQCPACCVMWDEEGHFLHWTRQAGRCDATETNPWTDLRVRCLLDTQHDGYHRSGHFAWIEQPETKR